MRIRPRFEHWLPRRLGISAIVLYPFVLFALSRSNISSTLLQHEMIHVRQVRKLGWFTFYFRYLREYWTHFRKLRDPNAAYLAISFEAEAYAGQNHTVLTELEEAEYRSGERIS